MRSSSAAHVVAHGLVRRFGDLTAVDGIDLDVGQGEIVCLLGPSGSGKSTLLRLAAGLEDLQSGALTLDDEPLAGPTRNPPPESRPVGMVFQDHVLFPHYNVSENVAFGLMHLSPGERSRVTEEALAGVGLAGLGKRHPHTLPVISDQAIHSLPLQRMLLLADGRHYHTSEHNLAYRLSGGSFSHWNAEFPDLE